MPVTKEHAIVEKRSELQIIGSELTDGFISVSKVAVLLSKGRLQIMRRPGDELEHHTMWRRKSPNQEGRKCFLLEMLGTIATLPVNEVACLDDPGSVTPF